MEDIIIYGSKYGHARRYGIPLSRLAPNTP